MVIPVGPVPACGARRSHRRLHRAAPFVLFWCRYTCLLPAVLIHVAAASADAAAAAYAADSIQVVQAEGYASIYAGDLGRARDEAIADARVGAIESLGFYLEGGATLSRGRLLDHGVRQRTQGFIVHQTVLEEGRRKDIPVMYRVRIEAWVKLALSPEERRRYRRKFSLVLDIPQEVLDEGESVGRSMRRRSVENALRDALIADGFQVYNRRQLGRIGEIDALLDQARERDPQSLRVVSDYAMAEVVVTGKVEVEYSSKGPETDLPTGERVRGYFYRAHPDVFAMEADSGREIAGYSHDEGIKGYQLSPRRAAQDAATKAKEPVIQEILEGLRRYAGSDRITVTVAITGLPDVSKYRVYQRLLKGLRWVDDVQANDFKGGRLSTYQVTYKEKFFFLLSQMHRLPGLDGVEGSNLRITAVYIGLPSATE